VNSDGGQQHNFIISQRAHAITTSSSTVVIKSQSPDKCSSVTSQLRLTCTLKLHCIRLSDAAQQEQKQGEKQAAQQQITQSSELLLWRSVAYCWAHSDHGDLSLGSR
jgi:hypothetical protein